ncbi:CHAT domain-containing protein [Microcoleus sp. herbarium14]|uniref:CHAT domain-containing protein n=1 Tax=Microcoleus sp. herbarium14 TaxID=3055439 RepID=UPI0034DE3ECE
MLWACETALIDTQNRSDYIGLPTGFLYAGAMGTLASLWAFNDLSTALMNVTSTFRKCWHSQKSPAFT